MFHGHSYSVSTRQSLICRHFYSVYPQDAVLQHLFFTYLFNWHALSLETKALPFWPLGFYPFSSQPQLPSFPPSFSVSSISLDYSSISVPAKDRHMHTQENKAELKNMAWLHQSLKMFRSNDSRSHKNDTLTASSQGKTTLLQHHRPSSKKQQRQDDALTASSRALPLKGK